MLEQSNEIVRGLNRIAGVEVLPACGTLLSKTRRLAGVDDRKASKSLGNAIGLTVSTTRSRRQCGRCTRIESPARREAGAAGRSVQRDRVLAAAVDVAGTSLSIATIEDVIIAQLEWAKLGGYARQTMQAEAAMQTRDIAHLPVRSRAGASCGLTERNPTHPPSESASAPTSVILTASQAPQNQGIRDFRPQITRR